MCNPHTPGPWDVGPYNNVHDTDTGESVAVVTDRHGEEANARLIAAAPELLAALKHFEEWHADHFEEFASDVNAQLLCLANEAQAAISKAVQS